MHTIVPPTDASPEKIFRWRISVAVWIIVISMTLFGYIAFANGLLVSVIGFSGYARADTVQDVLRVLNSVRLSQLDTKILDDQTRFCKAQESSNGDAMREISKRLYRELDDWRELSRKEYRLPPCDIMIAK